MTSELGDDCPVMALLEHMTADCYSWSRAVEGGGCLFHPTESQAEYSNQKHRKGKHGLSPVWRLRGLAPR